MLILEVGKKLEARENLLVGLVTVKRITDKDESKGIPHHSITLGEGVGQWDHGLWLHQLWQLVDAGWDVCLSKAPGIQKTARDEANRSSCLREKWPVPSKNIEALARNLREFLILVLHKEACSPIFSPHFSRNTRVSMTLLKPGWKKELKEQMCSIQFTHHTVEASPSPYES